MRAAADAHAHGRAETILGLQLARRRAVDGVVGAVAERLDGEVDDAAADLLVRIEGDLDRAVRAPRCEARCAIAAMIGSAGLSSAPEASSRRS